jgi:SAM-dependent methyltransferase
MGFYDRHILPRFINCACGSSPIKKQREKVVPGARGVVLEIGIGTGLNLPFYDPEKVERVIGLDPSEESWQLAAERVAQVEFDVDFVGLPEGDIPLEDASVDTILITYALCTIPDPVAALNGMRRVLRPSGKLIFCEHGKAPDAKVHKWQNRLDGMWGKIAGGCHLNRDIPAILDTGGFKVGELNEMYLPNSPRFASYNSWGTACVAHLDN